MKNLTLKEQQVARIEDNLIEGYIYCYYEGSLKRRHINSFSAGNIYKVMDLSLKYPYIEFIG